MLIGFEQTAYTTSEDVGYVEVCAVVKGGVFTSPSTATVTAMDGSANREFLMHS